MLGQFFNSVKNHYVSTSKSTCKNKLILLNKNIDIFILWNYYNFCKLNQ
nr:MAG TPA: hypothetical protein [Caudoviricetes sp.]DAX38076.1 MAG TPA: hypothetical protein [Caudoviricetes sp.]